MCSYCINNANFHRKDSYDPVGETLIFASGSYLCLVDYSYAQRILIAPSFLNISISVPFTLSDSYISNRAIGDHLNKKLLGVAKL